LSTATDDGVKLATPELVPGLISLTIIVPAEVPSDVHNSIPVVEVETENRSLPFILANIRGKLPVAPDTMSFTMYVPAAVPSDRQSSDP
jgi:hypothetical protein